MSPPVVIVGRAGGNAVKLGPDCEDVDLRRLGVELDSVGWSFDAVAVRPVSFDDPGTCPVPSWSEAFFGDLVDGFGERVGESVRGKSPPGWEFGADCAVASHEGEVEIGRASCRERVWRW